MKKIVLSLITIISLSISIYFLFIYKEEIIIDKTFIYDSYINLKDIIDIDEDIIIDTDKLYKDSINYTINNKKYIINYEVIDNTPPLIKGGDITSIKGNDIDLVNSFLCGDYYDNNPKCYIEGSYDINTIGEYNLTYVAIDSSNNISTKDFKLSIIDDVDTDYDYNYDYIEDTYIDYYIDKFKNDNTLIGIDASEWQGNLDMELLKSYGVEFIIIRFGFGKDEVAIDGVFKNNLEKAKKANIPVGLYFYSYALNKDESEFEALEILKELNNIDLELPIYFDWENWYNFNSYNISFKELNDIADTFINTLENNGYKASIYSSAYYLNNIWNKHNDTWIAYYYEGYDFFSEEYDIWQVTNSARINGINAYFDINIKKK